MTEGGLSSARCFLCPEACGQTQGKKQHASIELFLVNNLGKLLSPQWWLHIKTSSLLQGRLCSEILSLVLN